MTTRPRPDYDPIDLASAKFWASTAEERDESYAILRRERPVSWQPPVEGGLLPPSPDDEGFWAVVRQEDIRYVSTNPELFCSGKGHTYEDLPPEIAEIGTGFIAMDAPRHTALRKLVSVAFTPKRVKQIEAQIKQQAATIVDDLLAIESGSCDFVEAVAQRLPTWTISEMMGVPEAQREEFGYHGNALAGWNDPRVRGDRDPAEMMMGGMVALNTMARELATERRATPREDLMTSLVQAEVDGQRLTDAEIGSLFVLFAIAGNDTTRNTTSLAMQALCNFPDQRAWLEEDLDARLGTAIEEFLRWASPVMTFRRTATKDLELGGQQIYEGDKVVMFYSSGNRDESAFADPWTFDLARDPNPQIAFGGGGPHFCLGSMIAKVQLRSLFTELLTRVPDLQVGEPDFVLSNFIHTVGAMPCKFTPRVDS